jgi:hypothetical protein
MAVSPRDMIKAHFFDIYILAKLGLAVRAVMLVVVSRFGEGWLGQSCAIVVLGVFGLACLRLYAHMHIARWS